MIPKRCPVCGATVPLHAVHVVPFSTGGAKSDRSNVVYMCPSCHFQMDRGTVRELEFQIVLADLMRASGQYANVAVDPEFSGAGVSVRSRPDILATSVNPRRTVVVECKGAQTVSGGRLLEAVALLKRYQDASSADELVLALPARLTPEQRDTVTQTGVQVWDLDEIVVRFKAVLDGVTHPILRPLLLATAAIIAPNAALSPETGLLNELRELAPGPTAWRAYQKLVSRILERLFCPPLSPPIIELPDDSGTNRRDIILPNYAETGFWAFVRQRYDADFLVVDAKNLTDGVGKEEALQVLNYLKSHGAGLLGMIVCRKGWDGSCETTIREKWVTEGKLVVVFSDEDLERMLLAKESGGPPEDVVRQWLEEFRLSM